MLRLSKADHDRWTFRPRGETITEEPRRPASASIFPLSPGGSARRRRWCRARVRSWAGTASGLCRISSGSWERLVRRLAGGGVAWALPSGAAPPRSRIEPLKKDKKGRRSRPPFPVRPHCVHPPLLRTPSDGVVGGAAILGDLSERATGVWGGLSCPGGGRRGPLPPLPGWVVFGVVCGVVGRESPWVGACARYVPLDRKATWSAV